MSLIVKIMSDENAPDEDTRKSYKLITGVQSANFYRDGDSAYVTISYGYGNLDGLMPEDFIVVGNVYVMNESGKTISSFGAAPIPEKDYAGWPGYSEAEQSALAEKPKGMP